MSALFGRNLKGKELSVYCNLIGVFVLTCRFAGRLINDRMGIEIGIVQCGKRVRIRMSAAVRTFSFKSTARIHSRSSYNCPRAVAVCLFSNYDLKGKGLSVYYDRVSTLTRFSTSGCFRLNVIVISRVERRKRLGNGMRRIVYTRLGESSLSVLSRCNRNYPVAVGVSRCCDCNLKLKRLTVYIIGIKVISVCFAGRQLIFFLKEIIYIAQCGKLTSVSLTACEVALANSFEPAHRRKRRRNVNVPVAVFTLVNHTDKELRERIYGETDRRDRTVNTLDLNYGKSVLSVNASVVSKLFDRSVVKLVIYDQISVLKLNGDRDRYDKTQTMVVLTQGQILNADIHQLDLVDVYDTVCVFPLRLRIFHVGFD